MVRIVDANSIFRRLVHSAKPSIHRMYLAELDDTPTFWVWDGPGSLTRRRNLWPAYKAQRPTTGEDIYASLRFFAEILANVPGYQIEVPGYEADDVVATLARTFAKEGMRVEVHSTDSDFLQLTDDNVEVTSKPIEGVDPSRVRLYKTLVGDAADNIPGMKGFGPGKFKSLPEVSMDRIESALEGDDDVREAHDWSPSELRWLSSEENHFSLHTFWEIVGFYDVPMGEIEAHMVEGLLKPDWNKIEKMLKENLL